MRSFTGSKPSTRNGRTTPPFSSFGAEHTKATRRTPKSSGSADSQAGASCAGGEILSMGRLGGSVFMNPDAKSMRLPWRRCAALTAIFALAMLPAATARAQDPEPQSLSPDDPEIRSGLVQVLVLENEDEISRAASGFIVGAAGHVLTSAHLFEGGENIRVLPLAAPANPLEGRVVHANARSDLALLAVEGLPANGLPLALDGFDPGRIVYSAGIWSAAGEAVAPGAEGASVNLASGAVGEASEIPAAAGAPAVPLLSHNAMIPAAGYGGPLLNECGEVAGVNRGTPGVSALRLRRGEAPEGAVFAAGITALVGLMNEAGIPVSRIAESCVSAREVALSQAAEAAERARQAEEQAAQAQSEADAAQSRAEEAETLAQQAESLAQQAQSESQQAGEALAEAQQQLDQAAVRAEEAEALVSELEAQYEEAVRTGADEAETLRAELDAAVGERDANLETAAALQAQLTSLQAQIEQQQAVDEQRLYLIVGAAAAVLSLLLLFFFIYSRRRSRELALAAGSAAPARAEAAAAGVQMELAAAAAARDALAPDCVLDGTTAEGAGVSLKIPGSMLAGDGSVIGRNPRNSTFLIDDRTLSREHARLYAEEDRLLIENLGATNGVTVNGRELADHDSIALRDGAAIELGGVRLRVSLR
ncbi:MAG: FHA domain-containing protein [Gammaproteobacteria bacterium]|nr:FHA domain-containing protein [Gammaproteobacteria bacterium]